MPYAGQGQKSRAGRGLDALEDLYSPWRSEGHAPRFGGHELVLAFWPAYCKLVPVSLPTCTADGGCRHSTRQDYSKEASIFQPLSGWG